MASELYTKTMAKANGKQMIKGMVQRALFRAVVAGTDQNVAKMLPLIKENCVANFDKIMALAPASTATSNSKIPVDKQTPAYKEAMEMKRQAERAVRAERAKLIAQMGITV